MKKFNYLSKIRGFFSAYQSNDIGFDRRLTVVRPSFDCRSSLLKLVSVLVLILTIGSGNAWGGTATFTPTNAHTSEGDWSLENNGVTISWHGTDDDYIKVYKGGTLTITSSNTITALAFTFSNGSNNGGWNGSSASYSVTGLSTNSWSKTTTTGKSGKQARITELVVTFSGGATYTVQYAAGTGGSGTNPGSHTGVSSGSSITLKENTFTAPTGKQFAGWNDGSNTYAAGDSYTVTSDKTMTAQWSCIEPTISGQPASANYTIGDSPSGLSVTASLSSGTMTYLWKVSTNGGSTWSNASGTNNAATYAAANISTAAAGTTKYKCIVTNSTASCATESDVATITVSAPATPATVTLENYSGSDPTGLHVGDSYTLPSSNSFSCGTKTFVGWSTVEVDSPTKPGSNYYEPGGSVTISSASMTIYAVFATGTPGSPVEHAGPSFSRSGSSNTITSGYTLGTAADAKTGYYQDGGSVGDSRYVGIYHTSTAIFSSTPSSIKATVTVGGGTGYQELSNPVYVQLLNKSGEPIGTAAVVTDYITTAGGDTYSDIDISTAGITSAYGIRVSHTKESGYNVRYYSFNLKYYTGGGTTYSNYTTACTEAPTATFSNGTYTIGGSALDLSSLWTSNSSGAVTYTITNAGGTGASISTASFTATTPGTCTVQASQAAYGSYTAITKTAEITVQNPTCATPTFDNGTNTYYNDVTVTISCATGSSTIHYTTGASPADPTCSSGSTGTSVTISATGTTLKAVACKDGFNVSAVASATYTLKCATPTISVAGGAYPSAQSVTLGCTTDDATIKYTTDGRDPATYGITYSSAITISDDVTLKVVATKTNYANSEEATAAYIIKDCDWYESFNTNDGAGGNSGNWSGYSSMGAPSYDNIGWTVVSGGEGDQCIKSGTSKALGSAQTPVITVDNNTEYRLSFRMAPWNSTGSNASFTLSGGEISSGVSTWTSTSTMTDAEWNDYQVNFTTTSTSLQITFTVSGIGDNRFWLDEVCLKGPSSFTVTFDANGHGTAPSAITDVAKGSTINSSKPSDPTTTGWSFGGWYKESTCDNAWNWATDVVNSNITLWAKWTCSNPTSLSISSTGSKYDFCAGESMTLTVSGSNIGDGATYQWSLGGSPISGATSASYTTSMTAAKAGEYTCTVSNGSCSQTTSGFWVRVWQLHIDNGAAGAWQDLDFSNTGTGTGNNTTVALSADGSYHFKLKDNNGGWFGLNSKTVTGTESNIALNGTGANVNVNAGLGGNYTFAINYSDKTNPTISITYPTANQTANYDIWFDKSVVTGWDVAQTSDLFLRIGKSTNNKNNVTDDVSWSLVPGTDRFYTIKTLAYTGFEAWQIANNVSYSGSNSIYLVNGSGYEITKATDFQKYVVGSTGVTIVPTSSHNTENGCNYWYVTKTDGMLKHTATITTPTNGTIRLEYTSKSGSPSTSTVSDLPHRSYITATADPAPGYELSTFTVTPEGESSSSLVATNGVTNNHVLAKNATFAATFSAKTINITWDGNGGTPSKASDTWVYNDAALASLPTATNGSKIFVGWFTDPSAGSQIDNVGGSNKPTADVTYYAHWSDGNIVQFHAGVGSVTPDKLTQTTIGGAVSAFPTPTIDCEGWSFAGWKEGSAQAETTTNPEASLYAAGTDDYVPASATVNMYAVWKKNFGGGTGTIDNTYDWEATNSSWSTYSISNVRSWTGGSHVTPHGTYSGNTSATGAYVRYLTQMATPDSLVFYYTKATSNSNSNNKFWVETSTNGSTWTELAGTSVATNAMTRGTWEKKKVILTDKSNIYVRIYWNSAAGDALALDDVTIYYEGTRPDNWKWTSTAEDYGCVPANQVKTPVISPDTEAQTGDVSVTITCDTDGATIKYTTDGTDPSSSNGTTIASGSSFTLSCSATVKAFAYKATMDDSEIASQAYTITVPTPTFSLAEGMYYDANQTVTLSLPTAHTGTVIKYTTNGDDPSSSSTTYSSAITVTEGTTTIKAIGYNSTCSTSSSVASATYIVRFGTDYTLVTNVDDLNAGDQVVMVSADATTSTHHAISTTINSNKRTATTDFNLNAGLTTATIYPAVGAAATVQVFTLGGVPGAWTFHETTNNGYLNCPSEKKLTNTATVSNSNRWTITIASNIATIHNNAVDATIKSNTSSDHVFAAYGPLTENVQLVKLYSIPNPDPLIKVEADLSAFSACRGSASDYQSFIVSGKNLDGNIVISGPTGYEFCLTSGGSYTATLNIEPVTKTIAKTTVYVRLAATATAGAHNGNLNAAVSANSLSTNIAVTGSVSTADTFTDQVHNTVVANECGSYLAPSCADTGTPADASCVETHFKFMGWITETDRNASGVKDDAWYMSHLITAGTAMTANGTNYYAVWAREED